jgi:hypothetical protein
MILELLGRLGRIHFFVMGQVNYLAYVEINIPKYRVFCIFTRKTHFVKHLALELLLSL